MRFPREEMRLAKAVLLLNTIKNDPERLDLVHELQRMLIRRITNCENRILHLRTARKRMSRLRSGGRSTKERSKKLKELIKAADMRIAEMRQLMFLWRCFGDGIAAVYQSKYALKHLYYDAKYAIKEDAGFLSGKAGFRREYKALCLGIRMGVPVVLSDVTNIIRHGDVCGLAGQDPLPIEIKLSKRLDKGGKRQIEQIQQLLDFFANDGAANFRNVINVKRISVQNEEINFTEELNYCMDRVTTDGISTVAPERGLRYIAFRYDMPDLENKLTAEIAKYQVPSTHCTQLTPEISWLPMYPFTLSMSPANTMRFMQQTIGVVVLTDLSVVKSLFAERGVHAVALMDGVHALQICLDPSDLMKGCFRVNEQRYQRIACEFQSLTWFVSEMVSAFEATKEACNTNGQGLQGIIFEPPAGWDTVRDCF